MGGWIEIDGARGEGGGQILRSALALSLVTGKPFRMVNIRAARRKPGLLRQHLTAVQAATQVGGAVVRGDRIGSGELVFEPSVVSAGEYQFSVGTAGSTTLVLQTVLLPLCLAGASSVLVLEGGTHNPMAPPFDFLQTAFLPILGRMGCRCETSLQRYGFYPAGGGRFTVKIDPVRRLESLDLLERGKPGRRIARAIVAALPRHIAEREREVIRKKTSWPDDSLYIEEVKESPGPGNVVLLEVNWEFVSEVFTGFGEKSVPAESVAGAAIDQMTEYMNTDVAVGPYLADQILLPFAIAGGGSFTTFPLSRHSTTNIEVIRRFLDVDVRVQRRDDNACMVGIHV